MLLKHFGYIRMFVRFVLASLPWYAFCLHSKRDVFMRLSQISFSRFIVNFLWHFVCLLFFIYLCSAYVYISHFPCAHVISIPFASISIGYYDYDYYCACVYLLFSIFLFCNAAFFIRSKFNVLFGNFMNRITINLSTSTTEKIHMKCTLQTTTTTTTATSTNEYNEYWLTFFSWYFHI